jgi:hypothetical protein
MQNFLILLLILSKFPTVRLYANNHQNYRKTEGFAHPFQNDNFCEGLKVLIKRNYSHIIMF